MQKIKFTATALMAVAACTMIIYSCKKADIKPPENIPAAADVRAKAIKAIQEKYGNVSAGFIYNVNKKADLFYPDASGKMTRLYSNNSFGGDNTASICPQYNCNNTGNPANLVIAYELKYVQRFYECETNDKSKIVVNWTVSVPFGINYVTSDVNIANTFGAIKFSPSGGSPTTLTSQAGTGDFAIGYIGTLCQNTIYSITYSFSNVPNSYMLSGTTIEANISLDNDCALVSYLVASGLTAAPAITDELDLPCERIDKVYVLSPPSIPAIASGNATAICTQPSGWQYVNYHQLEYRQKDVSSFNWDDQTSTVYWGIPSSGGAARPEFSPSDYVTLSQITASSGWWLVRYRNVKTGTCDIINPYPSGPTNGNWGTPSLWITEAWQY